MESPESRPNKREQVLVSVIDLFGHRVDLFVILVLNTMGIVVLLWTAGHDQYSGEVVKWAMHFCDALEGALLTLLVTKQTNNTTTTENNTTDKKQGD